MAFAPVYLPVGQELTIRCLVSGVVSSGTIQAVLKRNLILRAELPFQADAPIQVTAPPDCSLLCEVYSCLPEGDGFRLGAVVRHALSETAHAGAA